MSDFESEGAGCHAGSSKLAEAAEAAGNSDLLEKYKKEFNVIYGGRNELPARMLLTRNLSSPDSSVIKSKPT